MGASRVFPLTPSNLQQEAMRKSFGSVRNLRNYHVTIDIMLNVRFSCDANGLDERREFHLAIHDQNRQIGIVLDPKGVPIGMDYDFSQDSRRRTFFANRSDIVATEHCCDVPKVMWTVEVFGMNAMCR